MEHTALWFRSRCERAHIRCKKTIVLDSMGRMRVSGRLQTGETHAPVIRLPPADRVDHAKRDSDTARLARNPGCVRNPCAQVSSLKFAIKKSANATMPTPPLAEVATAAGWQAALRSRRSAS